ncbi:MAG: diacylglycerol kinase [Phycisphaerae bacterium]|nr:diacylglycerol kinase [Phycisphaerae bacterium]|tara:strand:- start:1494 stop:1979 length:486 start_codon:yes stop_codon:yes gene_type:complete
MRITLIVAAAENHAIGRDGDLPWRLRADMLRFRDTTIGHPVIMGRKTWESLPKPLVERTNIVLTRQHDFKADGGTVVTTIEEAIAACEDAGECFVIGGGEIYRLFLDRADRILLTRVHAEIDGDASFPPLDESAWMLISSESHEVDDRNDHAMTFQDWQRR